MANKHYEEIAQLSVEDIKEQIEEAKVRLSKLRFNHTVSPIEDSTQLRKLRKRIARLNTELLRKESGAEAK